MAQISWDEPVLRLFEAGIDNGVLYLTNGDGVAWNGLVSLEETQEARNTTTYLDGVKVLEQPTPLDFQALVTAFTFPDEFLEYFGNKVFDDTGMSISGQTIPKFGFSYRTLVGNSVEDTDYGYQIHILYNLVAEEKDITYSSISQTPELVNFSWTFKGTPSIVSGFYPTSHVIIDSRYVSEEILVYIEDILYGVTPADFSAVEFNATLPDLSFLVDVIPYFEPMIVSFDLEADQFVLSSGYGDVTKINIDGIYCMLPRTKLVPSSIENYYVLQP